MREIKFRAWIQEGDWIEPEEMEQKYIMTYDLAFEEFEPINDLLKGVEHLMQYTGLKDKNGQEIYEGDILGCDQGLYEVKWNSEIGLWMYGDNLGMCDAWWPFEVKGNIYENPELKINLIEDLELI
jgi:uncharacterized phage protein (TIGR01671 family)